MWDELIHGHLKQFFSSITEQAFAPWVHEQNSPARVDFHHAIGRGFEQEFKSLIHIPVPLSSHCRDILPFPHTHAPLGNHHAEAHTGKHRPLSEPRHARIAHRQPQQGKMSKAHANLHAEAIEKQLAVMDLTALTMCMEHELPVVVFDFRRKGNIQRVLEGDSSVGTVVTN